MYKQPLSKCRLDYKLHSTAYIIKYKVNVVHEQEHYLSRELELMLDRLESPAWNLALQSEQASLAQAPFARVPAAYHPKVGPPPPGPANLPPVPTDLHQIIYSFTLPLCQRVQCVGTSRVAGCETQSALSCLLT